MILTLQDENVGNLGKFQKQYIGIKTQTKLFFFKLYSKYCSKHAKNTLKKGLVGI